MIYRVFLALVGRQSGRWCRTCSQPIARRDRFGLSESVCAPCRS